ncbi:hypothetical protein ADS79_17785 [Brevibacillus reuszeri]|uniref:Uncharacterized protein n=1 Tax=Brevibacillus reuszeri TaxID=54915 RepID=A0A0K9YPS5_9BACL|nr:hypothetical protein ADS79_17785 [Brevibacillus reuszeri]
MKCFQQTSVLLQEQLYSIGKWPERQSDRWNVRIPNNTIPEAEPMLLFRILASIVFANGAAMNP